jgi:cation transport regulator
MPYHSRRELPDSIKENLPLHAQDIYREAFNSAWDEYSSARDRQKDHDRESTAHAVAWSAVKKKYHKNDSGEWVKVH